ncbi:Map microtubule affinity-regulating kinase [Phlyctochytrium bullatum]|nr:Map microtubule affinity-regulating kinase [Phlyctochytrium bullatum]
MLARKKFLGNYQILKTIGEGAFSKVKLGIHKETGQKVAIKIIDKKEMAAKTAKAKKAAEDRERKRKESEAAQQRQHQERARRASGVPPPDPTAANPDPSRRRSSAVPDAATQDAAAAAVAGGGGPPGTVDDGGRPARPVDPRGELMNDADAAPHSRPTSAMRRGSRQVSTGREEQDHPEMFKKEARRESKEKGDPKQTAGQGASRETESEEPSFMSTLQLEVQLLMRLDHPNIINLYQVMETEDECFVVMEFAAGGELIDYIAARNYLSEREARRLFRQIISAMDHCHMANVVHRDLKLENLLLTEKKDILISDFGLGRTFMNDKDDYMRTFCGTPNYAAVELISGIPYIGVKADIWAMGVVLFVMMTGRPPFTGDNIAALYGKIKAVDYKCPDYFSRELKALLGKILRRDPKARIDMEALRSDPWVNYEETEPPPRILPKVMGPPDPSQMGQLIKSIHRDSSSFVVFTIRQYMRNGVNIEGAGAEKNKTLQRNIHMQQQMQQQQQQQQHGNGSRRRSYSMGMTTSSGQPVVVAAKPTVAPPQRIGEDEVLEDGVGDLPSPPGPHFAAAPPSFPRSPNMHSRGRRMSMQETSLSRPPPTLDVSPPPHPSAFHADRTSVSKAQDVPGYGAAPHGDASATLSPPTRQRRNTITTLMFPTAGNDAAASHDGRPHAGGFLAVAQHRLYGRHGAHHQPQHHGSEHLSPDDVSLNNSRSQCEMSTGTLGSSKAASNTAMPISKSASMMDTQSVLATSPKSPLSHGDGTICSSDDGDGAMSPPGHGGLNRRNSRRASVSQVGTDRNLSLLRRMSMVSPPMDRRPSSSIGRPDWESIMSGSNGSSSRRRSSEYHVTGTSPSFPPSTSPNTSAPFSPEAMSRQSMEKTSFSTLGKNNASTPNATGLDVSRGSYPTDDHGASHTRSKTAPVGANAAAGGEDMDFGANTANGEETNISDDSALDLVPSRKEIEEWHMLHRPPKEIRTVRYSFNPSLTSTLPPTQVFQDVHRVLLMLQRHYNNRLSFTRHDDYYLLRCKLAAGLGNGSSTGPGDEEGGVSVEFEIEVCKVWLLKLHGVRLKRILGNALLFKEVYSHVCELLNIRGH